MFPYEQDPRRPLDDDIPQRPEPKSPLGGGGGGPISLETASSPHSDILDEEDTTATKLAYSEWPEWGVSPGRGGFHT